LKTKQFLDHSGQYRRNLDSLLTVIAIAVSGVVAHPHAVYGQATIRASVSSSGAQGDMDSGRPAISDDGRYVVFESDATTLVAGDTNGVLDVFVFDRISGDTVRVSVSSSGAQGNADSGRPVISGDGRFVAFYSDSSNFAGGDSAVFDAVNCPTCTGWRDVFVRDRDPDENGVFDEGNGTTTRVSISTGGDPGNGDSTRPTISNDGRYVGFNSDATNLVASDTNAERDVFVHDTMTGVTIRASESESEEGGNGKSDRPALSGDGRYVAFFSDATNLLAGDTNNFRDVYVKSLIDQSVARMGQPPAGGEPNGDNTRPAMSDDGRFVVFRSTATNLNSGDTNLSEDIYLQDRDPDGNGIFDQGVAGIEFISLGFTVAGDGNSSSPAISGDGRFVVFHSTATNIVAGDTNLQNDVFVHDRQTGKTTRVSVCGAGTEGDNDSERASISNGGAFVAFVSQASNLVDGDTNGVDDIFVRDLNFDGEFSACGSTGGSGSGGSSGGGTGGSSSGGACGAAGMLPLGLMFVALFAVRFRRRPFYCVR